MNDRANEFDTAMAAAGWHPGRNMTGLVSSWRSRILQRGGFWTPKAEAILAEYGELELRSAEKLVQGVDHSAIFGVDPMEVEADLLEEYEEGTGQKLCPIGFIEGGLYYLAMCSQGEIYIMAPESLRSLGTEPREVLELLFNNGRGVEKYPHEMEGPGSEVDSGKYDICIF